MRESRLMGGVRPALAVAGAVFGVALLSAGVASAAEPVRSKSRLGNWCLDGPNGIRSRAWPSQLISALGPCLNVFGGVAQPGTPVTAYHCIADVADEEWESV